MKHLAATVASLAEGLAIASVALSLSVAVVCPALAGWITPPGTPTDYAPLAVSLRSLACHLLTLIAAFTVLSAVSSPGHLRGEGKTISLANPITMWVAFLLVVLVFPGAPYAYVTITTWVGFAILGPVVALYAMRTGSRVRLAIGR